MTTDASRYGRTRVTKHDARPFKPADLRRAVTEWAERGFSVRIEADGAITVTPQPVRPRDDFDLVDMRK